MWHAVTRVTVVFPAPAGVIPDAATVLMHGVSFPRTCGGDPTNGVGDDRPLTFSPHLRG